MLLGNPRNHTVFLHQPSFERLDLAILGHRERGVRPSELEGSCEVLQGLLLPTVENTRLQLVLFAKRRDGDLVGEVASQNGDLLLRGELADGLARH